MFKQILIVSWEMCQIETKFHTRKLKCVTLINEINDSFSDIVYEVFNIEEILNIMLLGKEIDLKKNSLGHGSW